MQRIRDPRSADRISDHYRIEKELADRLRNSTADERKSMYTAVYNELFQRVPDHPQLTRKRDSDASAAEVAAKFRLVRRFLRHDTLFLEVGPGDCMFALEVAKHVKSVTAVDVSSEIVANLVTPSNFDLRISDGTMIPVGNGSITVAYSNQLMEHLHVDDAKLQLRNIWQALAPNGVYICITPNRYSGPHDISRHFDDVATGFHLKEYSHRDLALLLRSVGFRSLTTFVGGDGHYLRFPGVVVRAVEAVLELLPGSVRKRIGTTAPMRALLGAICAAQK